MKECYNLNDKFTVSEMEEIADIFYQRAKKIKVLVHETNDDDKRKKAIGILLRLHDICSKFVMIIGGAHKPIRPNNFKSAGVDIGLRRN